jgi:hypothetical protein
MLGSGVDTWATVAVAIGTIGRSSTRRPERGRHPLCRPGPVDGEWSGKAEMWEHLRVEVPRAVR